MFLWFVFLSRLSTGDILLIEESSAIDIAASVQLY